MTNAKLFTFIGILAALGGAVGIVSTKTGAANALGDSFFNYALFIGLLLVGVAFILFGWAVTFEDRTAKMSRATFGIFLSIVALIAFFLAGVGWTKQKDKQYSVFRTNCVPAEIISARIFESGKTGSRNYYWKIEYAFVTADNRRNEGSGSISGYREENKYKVCYEPRRIWNQEIIEDSAGAK